MAPVFWCAPVRSARLRQAAALVGLTLLASCGLPRNVVVLLPDEDGHVGGAVINAEGGQAELSKPLAAVGTSQGDPPGRVFAADQDQVQRAFAGVLAATPRAPRVFIVYFESGTADIEPRSTGALDEAIAVAKSTPDADISVVGHSDATGTDASNLALSTRRAEVVRDRLVAGDVAANTIEVTYYGSSYPRVPRPRGVPEPANRRVEVTIR